MFCIGIIGEKDNFISDNLRKLYFSKGIKVYTIDRRKLKNLSDSLITELEAAQVKVIIMSIKHRDVENIKGIKFNILIYFGGSELADIKNILTEENILIVDTDDLDKVPASLGINSTVITCGMNNKASITASSVVSENDWDTILCCIQRSIKTLSGEKIEPQEFAVNVDNNKNVGSVLATVACAIIDDMEVSELNFYSYKNYSSKS